MMWKSWPGLVLGLLLALPAWAGDPRPDGDLVHASGFERPTQSIGGSNYLWHDLGRACDREPYGLGASYHLSSGGGGVRARAQAQLAQMYANGMRRLSLGMYFGHGMQTGTVIDVSDPAQVAQALYNIDALLADVKAAGFEEILFRFFPVGTINPSYSSFDADLIDEYWALIQNVRPLLVVSGLPYKIDLMVEGAPRHKSTPLPSSWKYPVNEKWSRAVRTLWQRYKGNYDIGDSIGFSFLTDADPDRLRARVRHMRYVYEGDYPEVFAADLYADGDVRETDKFIALHRAMVEEDASGSRGWKNASWIIAEAFYDDPFAAAGLSAAIASTRRTVRYLTQWPLDRAGPVCDDVNVAPAYVWDVFGSYRF